MRTRVKAKSDRNRTGNRAIKLLKWEKSFHELLQEDENPVFCRISGAVSAGIGESPTQPIVRPCSSVAAPTNLRKRKRLAGETPETESLNNTELQRLVLLEQLSVWRLKKKILERKYPDFTEEADDF